MPQPISRWDPTHQMLVVPRLGWAVWGGASAPCAAPTPCTAPTRLHPSGLGAPHPCPRASRGDQAPASHPPCASSCGFGSAPSTGLLPECLQVAARVPQCPAERVDGGVQLLSLPLGEDTGMGTSSRS